MARGSSARPAEAVETPDTDGSAYVQTEQDAQTKRRQAYNAAETRLKEEFKDRFRELVQDEAGKRGVTYEFRKTEEEKAREKYEELLAKYPNLATPAQPEAEGKPEA